MIEKSLDIYAYNPYAHRNLGIAFLREGRIAPACDAFRRAIELRYDTAYVSWMQYSEHPEALVDRHCAPAQDSTTENTSNTESE